MRALMGFGGFDSTKGKPIPGKNVGAVNAQKEVGICDRELFNSNANITPCIPCT
jgi:hypothetical protein